MSFHTVCTCRSPDQNRTAGLIFRHFDAVKTRRQKKHHQLYINTNIYIYIHQMIGYISVTSVVSFPTI